MGFNYTGRYTEGLLSKYDVYKAIQTCITRVDKNQADAAALRWFGDNSMTFKKDLKKKLNLMRTRINLIQINVGFEDASTRDSDTNAAAYVGVVTKLDPSKNPNVGNRHVFLNANFKNLPNYLPLSGGTIDASDYNQSQFNTFVHELSHLILGTADEDLNNSETAYGAEQALQLVGEDSAKAKNNAENWGIFVEACGFHLSS